MCGIAGIFQPIVARSSAPAFSSSALTGAELAAGGGLTSSASYFWATSCGTSGLGCEESLMLGVVCFDDGAPECGRCSAGNSGKAVDSAKKGFHVKSFLKR